MSFLDGIGQLPFLLAGLLGFGFLIGFHELGHFLFCKLFGVRTPSFSIGFGPVLFKKRMWDTNFILSALPLGGFVEIAGAAEVGQGDQKEAKATDKGSFATKPYYQKMLIISGGIIFNMIFAYTALSALYYIGMPQTPLLHMVDGTTRIGTVTDGSPAEQAGLKIGDTILSIDGSDVLGKPLEFVKTIRSGKKAQVTLDVERQGTRTTIPVTVGLHKEDEPTSRYIGVMFDTTKPDGLFDSIKMGVKATNTFVGLIVESFKRLFKERSTKDLGGPILILSQTVAAAREGMSLLLLFLAFISINLAVLNVIPLPILDGGQALFYTIEAVMGRPLSPKLREYIHIACWLAFLALFVYLSIKDTKLLFWDN